MELYLFNPDSDLALANNEANYIAPASARRMAQDMALLPIWYAAPGSAVLAPSAYNADFLKRMRELFGLQVQLATEPELPDYAEARIVTWGWNPAIRGFFLKGGVREDRLPSPQLLAEYRLLSSRLQAVAVTRRIADRYPECTCGEHTLLNNIADCERTVNAMPACLLKVPWSGSGKGLNWCLHGFTKPVSNWCERVLREQGCLTAEPIYNKVKDFALEFYSDGQGEVRFAGYSVFSTNEHGAYTGNLLASDGQIEESIACCLSLEKLTGIREALRAELASIYGNTYTGYLGVDMMICRFALFPEFRIHPCVEINLRMNMGLVSRMLYDRYVRPGAGGTFRISYHPSDGQALQEHDAMTVAHPLDTRNGRVVKGYLPLVPVRKSSRYRAYILVETGG